ncbi:MAG: hypothetical protein ACI4T5_05445 [Prevotella sp.]
MKYILMSLTALALWACGDDNEPDVPQPSVSSAIEVKYQATLSDDLLKVADVTAYYVSADGTVKNEPVQASPWTKEVSIPADKPFGFALKYGVKSSATIDAEKEYSLKTTESISYDVKDQYASSMASGKKERSVLSASVLGVGIEAYLANISSSSAFRWDGSTMSSATVDWGFNAGITGGYTDTPVSGDPASDGAE